MHVHEVTYSITAQSNLESPTVSYIRPDANPCYSNTMVLIENTGEMGQR